jgi:hypothetical protein
LAEAGQPAALSAWLKPGGYVEQGGRKVMILHPKTNTPKLVWLVAPVAIVLSATGGSAQQTVPFRGSNPVAPTGIPAVPLPDTPVIYDTAEGQRIRVVVVARGSGSGRPSAFDCGRVTVAR